MSRKSRRLCVLAAGVLSLLAVGSVARAQEAPAPVPGPATTELAPVVENAVETGFTEEVDISADLFGVSWQGDPNATFTIETLESDGWTPAQEVGSMTAEGGADPDTPEAASTETGPYASEPLWSGDATAVRVAVVSGTATEIQIVAVTSGQLPDEPATEAAALAFGGTALALLAAVGLGTGVVMRLRRGAVVAAVIVFAVSSVVLVSQDDADAGGTKATPPENLIQRKEWGARKPQCDAGTFAKVRFAIVHHTAGGNSYGPFDGPGIVQGIQAYHMDLPGPDPYCDIAYNFLVDKYGNSYIGRARSTRVVSPIFGAHTSGHNKGSTGVSVLGNYDNASFPKAGRKELNRVLAWRFLRHGIDPHGATKTRSNGGTSHWPAGTKVEITTISGHRDFNPTACPGASIYSQLGSIRNGTAKRMT
jgi:N-acetylmuramoyl-L-alanine amidase